MIEAHIVLKSVLKNGEHEQIDILDVGSVAISDCYLKIFPTCDSVIPSVIGIFDMADIIGYWLDEM